MTCLRQVVSRSLAIGGLTLLPATALAQDSTHVLLRDFEPGWQKNWFERRLTRKATEYKVVLEDSNRVLMASSDEAASSLWRPLYIRPGRRGKIAWRWKIKKALAKDTRERSKIGDDYAARVYVVFEPHMLSWKTRAICYVWAANQPVGAQYDSPYANTVRTIVLQSGNENRGKWVEEEHDFIEDYRRAFRREPEMIIAVAVMVDTDNSKQEAIAWFDDLVLRVPPPPSGKPSGAGTRQGQ